MFGNQHIIFQSHTTEARDVHTRFYRDDIAAAQNFFTLRCHDRLFMQAQTNAVAETGTGLLRKTMFGQHCACSQIGLTGADTISDDSQRCLLRLRYGVLVMGCDDGARSGDDGLAPGDVIHAVNGIAIDSVQDLQALIERLDQRIPVALQVERAGQLRFVAVPLD